MREAFARMRDWFRRGQLGTEFQEELRFHRDRLERDAAASRAPGDDVVHIASRRLGSELRARESARERWSFRMAQDIRYALAGAGLVFWLGVALVASRWMQPLLFNESARDPIVYGVVGVLIMIVAVAASMAPALRASRADPNTVPRTD